MTANKDLKRIIRRRMYRTGESYTAARRHFLVSENSRMIKQATQTDEAMLGLSIDQLQLTLKTTRILKSQGIERIGQLVKGLAAEAGELRLEQQSATEVRDVLASRGL
jgi:DNA-directed RNA polymerase alpha subunit